MESPGKARDPIPQAEYTWMVVVIVVFIAFWFVSAFALGVGGSLIACGSMSLVIGAATVARGRPPLQSLFPMMGRRYSRPGLASRQMLGGTMLLFLGAARSVESRTGSLVLTGCGLIVAIVSCVAYLPLLNPARWRRPLDAD